MARLNYGPPNYDVSKVATYHARIQRQAQRGRPKAMYSSDWKEFGRTVLRGNTLINRELKRIATRGLFNLRQIIPLGTPEEGHSRDKLKVRKQPRGGFNKDRDTYVVDYAGRDYDKWVAQVKRSTYPTKESWQNALRGADGSRPFGPSRGWIGEAARRTNR